MDEDTNVSRIARAPLVTLCGSSRFEDFFHVWAEALGSCGVPAFGLSAWPSHRGAWSPSLTITPGHKARVDALHLDKIERSDAILVLNVYAYVGESTLREIAHARKLGKLVYTLESWGKGCGIERHHRESYRAGAKRFGVPEGYVSPFDASHGWTQEGRNGYPFDLLGHAGAERSAAARFINEATRRLEETGK